VTIFKLLKGIISVLKRNYEEYKYDSSNIAEKFRKAGAKIGENCFLQMSELASEPYLVEIGNNVAIAAGVSLITHDGASVILRDEYPYLRFYGKIVIEDNCFIGRGAVICAGVRIGKNSIVGPMSVVIKDVKPGSVVIGNPAIQVSTVDKYRERCLKEWNKWKLDRFERLFEGMDKFEVQRIMQSEKFQNMLKEHFLSMENSESMEGGVGYDRGRMKC
jgi:acetyltransferase-like isoleucine patch superfamily enzyme